jgi:glutamyl/glutaminyl-tRNA synthetase
MPWVLLVEDGGGAPRFDTSVNALATSLTSGRLLPADLARMYLYNPYGTDRELRRRGAKDATIFTATKGYKCFVFREQEDGLYHLDRSKLETLEAHVIMTTKQRERAVEARKLHCCNGTHLRNEWPIKAV